MGPQQDGLGIAQQQPSRFFPGEDDGVDLMDNKAI